MAKPGQNEGFHVLDDFVCQAIHDPSVPLANPANQGRNEGMSVLDELLFDASGASTLAAKERDTANGTIAVTDVARSGWSGAFSGAAAAAAFSGLVGAVLRLVGAAAALKDSRDPVEPCKLCGRSGAGYSLRCCRSATCETCLSKMLTAQSEDAVGFRCAVCGYVYTETGSAKPLPES